MSVALHQLWLVWSSAHDYERKLWFVDQSFCCIEHNIERLFRANVARVKYNKDFVRKTKYGAE